MADEISMLFSNNKSLNYISLSNCGILEAEFLKIANSLINADIIHLDISSNVITNNIAYELIRNNMFHENSQLQHLDILNCNWHENSLQILLNATVHVNSLRSINVGGCEIDNAEAECWAAWIFANEILEQLILANRVIQTSGLVSVFEALKKLSTLNYLDLSFNCIGKETVHLLAESICGNQIEHLNLSNCSLRENDSVVLKAIANCGTLQYLDLSYNCINDYEANSVASAITYNGYLYHLNLTNNNFSRESLNTILNAMAKICALQYVDLSSYLIGELIADLVAVAISNPELESVLGLNSKCKLVSFSKVIISYLRLYSASTFIKLMFIFALYIAMDWFNFGNAFCDSLWI